MHGRRSGDAGELDAGPVQYDVHEGHGRRVLHPGANPAAPRAAPVVSEAGVAGRTARCANRRAGGRVLHAVAIWFWWAALSHRDLKPENVTISSRRTLAFCGCCRASAYPQKAMST